MKTKSYFKRGRNMNKTILKIMVAAFFAIATSGLAVADPGPYDATMTVDGYDATPDAVQTPKTTNTMPNIFNAINELIGTSFTSNDDTDSYQVTSPNAFWKDLGGGIAGPNFAAIGITASLNNSLFVYEKNNPANETLVFSGLSGFGWLTKSGSQINPGDITNPFIGAQNPFASGEDFGFRLKSSGSGLNNVWDSDDTKNIDGLDHMLAFHLPELENINDIYVDLGAGPVLMDFSSASYLLAFEDLPVDYPTFDSDYNDTIWLVTRVKPIPEPMTMVLMGSGLAAMAGVRRRKRA
ncbi:MAG: PEP-CTERM sorting domain-containing protein [Candidatus Omnitrophica bacterium]|nr:PEP-CTERM sorting domain-containing protein [Candidatus Omnitrophota bacterium]